MGILNKITIMILTSMMVLDIGCKKSNESIIESEVDLKKVKIIRGGCFDINYSNIILNYDGTDILLPIYGGKTGTIRYDTLLKHLKREGLINDDGVNGLSAICLNQCVKKGEVKKTIIDCIKFYQLNFLNKIEVEKASTIGIEDGYTIIWYDFKYHGKASSFGILVQSVNPVIDNNVYHLNINESSNAFSYIINIGSPSGFVRDDNG